MYALLCPSSVNQMLKLDCLALLFVDHVCLSKHKLPVFGPCSIAALSRDAVETSHKKTVFCIKQWRPMRIRLSHKEHPVCSKARMEGETTTALDKKASDRTGNAPSRGSRQLKTKTHKSQEDRYASRRLQSRTPASQSRNDEGDDQDVKLDDDTRDGGNSGDEDDHERDQGVGETNNQLNSDVIEDTEDMRDDDGAESESESFLEIYGTFRTEISEATRREAEEEFLRNKRELIGLPKEREQNSGQQKAQRFCTWSLRQIKRRIKVLEKEEAERGEDSGSDGLSESDEQKMWTMYGIIAEDDTQYLVAWKGSDKKTGQDYGDESTAKSNVEGKGKREWQAYKGRKTQGEE